MSKHLARARSGGEGRTLIERRDGIELFCDQAAEAYERHTGSSWRPRAGSKVNHRALTAAMIDSRDFLAAKRRTEIEPLLPAGPKIAFTGGLDFNDHRAIWDRLDKVRAKHPDMACCMAARPEAPNV
jgi:YspA, cpYpsA-related SLOG family